MSESEASPIDLLLARTERVFKLALAIIGCIGTGVIWGVRLEGKTSNNEQRSEENKHGIRDLDMQQRTLEKAIIEIKTMLQEQQRRGGGNQTQSIKVGIGEKDNRQSVAKARGYYTTADLAAMLNLSERTVTERCARGDFAGATQPEGGRGWRIPLDYFDSGKLPQTAAISEPPPDEEAEACP